MSSDRPSRDDPSIRFPTDRFESLPPDMKDQAIAKTFDALDGEVRALRRSLRAESKSTRRALWAVAAMLLIPIVTTLVMVGAYRERVDRMQVDLDRLRARVEAPQ